MAEESSVENVHETNSQQHVEVMYSYKYTDDYGNFISMEEGEIYRLLSVDSDDWWEVCRFDDSTPFYVPKTYVRKVIGNTMKRGPGDSSSSGNVDGSSETPDAYSFVNATRNQDATGNKDKLDFKVGTPSENITDNQHHNEIKGNDLIYANTGVAMETTVQNLQSEPNIHTGQHSSFTGRPTNFIRAFSLNDGGDYANLEDFRRKAGIPSPYDLLSPESPEVSHSQRLNAKPLKPWIIASPQGTVLSAHCTCMAGLGETCSHVAALLFYIEEMQKYRERVSVTGKLAYWKKPTKKSVEYKELSNIDFRSATKLKQLTDNPDADATQSTPYRILNLSAVPAAGISDMKQILQTLEKNNKKPAIMTLVEPFCEKFKPLPQSEHLPSSLFTLRNENTDSMSLEQLLDYCSKLSISIKKEQAVAVEKETRLQNKCKLWHNVREGRITSTTLHSVCHTNPEAPSISLLKSLTSASVSVQTHQMVWGVKMEDVAKRQYTEKMNETHDSFSINPCGFFLHPDMPFMGSSPDGMVSCVCCGKGCIEIKCPFSAKDMKIEDALAIKNFCLVKEDDKVTLCRTHPYYSQVQCHIHMSGSEYCDFIVWTKSDIFIERIEPNTAFWNNAFSKANIFWQSALLPELVAKYFTRRVNDLKPHSSTTLPSPAESVTNSQSIEEELWCSCRKPEYGRMIACDDKSCLYQWFHFECVGLKRPQKGLWYCLECRQNKQKTNKGKASKKKKK